MMSKQWNNVLFGVLLFVRCNYDRTRLYCKTSSKILQVRHMISILCDVLQYSILGYEAIIASLIPFRVGADGSSASREMCDMARYR